MERSDVMRKVQALLDRAASTTFDGERDSCIAKADAMMASYAIEQFELDMARPAHQREKPEVRDVTVSTASNWEVAYQLRVLFEGLSRHCGVLIGTIHHGGPNEYIYKLVGYASDLDYLQMLYVNVQLHLVSRMEPQPDPNKTEVENFCALREAGLDYERIFKLMGLPWDPRGHGHQGGKIVKLKKAYHDLCAAEGRKPVKGLKRETYRKSFLRGYVSRINDRLWEMAEARTQATTGKGLVLASRDGDLKEALWDAFPDRRPHPADCECQDCHVRKCRDPKCMNAVCKASRKPIKFRSPRDEKVDYEAREMGRSVANSADLNAGRNNVGGKIGELS